MYVRPRRSPSSPPNRRSRGPQVAELRGFLESQGSPAFAADDRGAELWQVLQTFYANRDYEPAWVRDEPADAGRAGAAPGHRGRGARRAAASGTTRARSGPHAVAAAGRPGRTTARLDVAITYAFLRYASDLAAGSVDPRGAASLWRVSTRTFDAAALLDEAVDATRPVSVLEAVRPAHPQYAALSDALVRYRRIAAAGGWPARSRGREEARRRGPPRRRRSRARLQASGDTLEGVPAAPRAARRPASLDRETLAALNVPVEDRIRQIELNLERWRWQGWEPGGRTILVNVPTFELHAYEDGREALTMRVITGTGDSQTPVFAEQMNQVVFSPHWNVPANILETEVLPAIRRNPGYLASKNMEMVRTASGDVSVRQRPGPRNALGLVKFLFPNPFNVYLHDTPGGRAVRPPAARLQPRLRAAGEAGGAGALRA